MNESHDTTTRETTTGDMLTLALRLRRAEGEDAAQIVLMRDGALLREAGDEAGDEAWLHDAEALTADAMRSASARARFLLGRYAAKCALKALRPQLAPQEVEIRRGVFGQPVVVCPQAGDLAVSIAHCDGLAAAVAFPQGHPLGIDVETVASVDAETARGFVAPHELAPGLAPQEAYARAWCAKESLGKILRCGLAAPSGALALAGEALQGAAWRGRFVAHDQYAFVTLRAQKRAFALAHPARTQPLFDEARLLAFLG